MLNGFAYLLVLLIGCVSCEDSPLPVVSSTAYDDFLSLYGRHDRLEINDINDLTWNLLRKMNCNSNPLLDCRQCLNSAKLQMSGLIGTTVERSEFKSVSIVIFCYLADLPKFCIVNSLPNIKTCYNYLTNNLTQFDTARLEEILVSQLKPRYKPEMQVSNYSRGLSSVECIDAKSLVNKYKTVNINDLSNGETISQIASDIISSLYNDAPIGCDYPYPTWFIDQLYDSYLSNNKFTIQSLGKMMNEMGLESSKMSNRLKRSVFSRLKPAGRNIKMNSKYDKCYTAEDLINIFQVSKDSISKSDLQLINSALTYLTAKNVCKMNTEAQSQTSRSTNAEKYGYGTIAIFIVSSLAVLGIFLLPCFKKPVYEDILTALSALAMSTLFCDAMLHILPEILGMHHDDDEHSDKIEVPTYILRICILIAAIYIFWLLEVLFYKITGSHAHSHGQNGPTEKDRLTLTTKVNEISIDDKSTPTTSYGSYSTTANTSPSNNSSCSPTPFVVPDVAICDSMTTTTTKVNRTRLLFNFKNVKATAWMLILSDGIHNFADGLAVGASFADSVKLGLSTTIAIVFHEIPHELGNYAVLVKCGLTHSQAILLNVLSACSCFIGFYVGVSISANEEISLWIFSVTAGMFFYIALVDLLPNLLGDRKWTWRLFFIINSCLWLGFTIMFLLVIFEDRISI